MSSEPRQRPRAKPPGDQAAAEPVNDATENVSSASRTPVVDALAKYYHKVARPQEPDSRITLAVIICAAVIYGVLYFAIGSVFLPGHAAWATLLLWASSHIGGYVAHQLRLPRVIGMLATGLLMRNIPWNAVTAFPARWGIQMRAAALATIFLRCGLELEFGTMKRYKYPAIRLALIPGLCEAFYDGALATAPGLFGMPVLLGFTMGFIMKAVGPGLVVPAMFKLQRIGLGRDQGIPSTIVISASFDDIVAITGFAIFSNIAINGGSSADDVGWQIAKGPLQVIFGIVGGIIGGTILGCSRIFDSRLKRFVGMFGGGLLIMFFLEYYGMLSGGALGALTIGLVASNFWERGIPRRFSLGANFQYSPEVERVLAIVWSWVMEPMLFVTIGSSIYFKSLSSGTVPKALVIICTGLIVRIITTFFAMSGFGYTFSEKVFYAIAWTPKATVQAALSGTPLAMIQATKVGQPDYAEWEQWGYDILTTGVFTIIVCATLGMIAIHFTADRLLEMPIPKDEEPDDHGSPPSPSMVEQTLVSVTSQQSQPVKSGNESGAEQPLPGVEIALEDYEIVALYLDAISELSSLVASGKQDAEKLQYLADKVSFLKRRLEVEVGQRELTVRELFRSASLLAENTPIVVRNSRTGLSRQSSLTRVPSGKDDAPNSPTV